MLCSNKFTAQDKTSVHSKVWLRITHLTHQKFTLFIKGHQSHTDDGFVHKVKINNNNLPGKIVAGTVTMVIKTLESVHFVEEKMSTSDLPIIWLTNNVECKPSYEVSNWSKSLEKNSEFDNSGIMVWKYVSKVAAGTIQFVKSEFIKLRFGVVGVWIS